MTFKNKADFIDFIHLQTGVALRNEKSELNQKRRLLYTEINRACKNRVLSYLEKIGVVYENHVKDFYWIYIC